MPNKKVTDLLTKFLKISIFILIIPISVSSCKGPDGKFKIPGADARKYPADPAKRIEQNLKDGRGINLMDLGKSKGGVFDFASSNGLRFLPPNRREMSNQELGKLITNGTG